MHRVQCRLGLREVFRVFVVDGLKGLPLVYLRQDELRRLHFDAGLHGALSHRTAMHVERAGFALRDLRFLTRRPHMLPIDAQVYRVRHRRMLHLLLPLE